MFLKSTQLKSPTSRIPMKQQDPCAVSLSRGIVASSFGSSAWLLRMLRRSSSTSKGPRPSAWESVGHGKARIRTRTWPELTGGWLCGVHPLFVEGHRLPRGHAIHVNMLVAGRVLPSMRNEESCDPFLTGGARELFYSVL